MVESKVLVKHTLEIHKKSKRHLNHKKIESQINKITATVGRGGRGNRGWTFKVTNPKDLYTPIRKEGEYIYVCKIEIFCISKKERNQDTLKQDFDNIIKVISSAGGTVSWAVGIIDGKIADPNKDERVKSSVGYVPVELPKDWRDGVKHIYERDNQIDIIVSAIEASIASNFQDRFHCALVGEPACGKTETLRSFKNILGEDAVLEYDATATTQAGAIKDLDQREELPRILIVEEIEKTDENSLRWLLSVLDHRAEIRKVNFKEQIQRETRLLTLATVNDYKLFKKIMFGALASRFAYHIHFPKPDRELLEKILTREVLRINGNKKWIKPTLDFAEEEGIYDPRKVTAICLCGRDELFKGIYQKKLRACSTGSFIKDHEKNATS